MPHWYVKNGIVQTIAWILYLIIIFHYGREIVVNRGQDFWVITKGHLGLLLFLWIILNLINLLVAYIKRIRKFKRKPELEEVDSKLEKELKEITIPCSKHQLVKYMGPTRAGKGKFRQRYKCSKCGMMK